MKIFYTERDIEDMFRSGLTRLEVHDDVVLTDLAREKAVALGIALVAPGQAPSSTLPSSKEIVRGLIPIIANYLYRSVALRYRNDFCIFLSMQIMQLAQNIEIGATWNICPTRMSMIYLPHP